MGKVQIFCEQRALFEHPKDKSVSHLVEPFVFAYAPDWVIGTEFWKMLEKDKKAKVIGSKKDVAAIETVGKVSKEKVAKLVKEEVKESEEEVEESKVETEEIKSLSEMSNKELFLLCNERGIKAEAKMKKPYYLKLLGYEE